MMSFLFNAYLVGFMLTFTVISIIEKTILKRLFYGLFCFFSILMITETYQVIPFFIMKELKLGQIEVENIRLKEDGCKKFNLDIDINHICEKKNLFLLWKGNKI